MIRGPVVEEIHQPVPANASVRREHKCGTVYEELEAGLTIHGVEGLTMSAPRETREFLNCDKKPIPSPSSKCVIFRFAWQAFLARRNHLFVSRSAIVRLEVSTLCALVQISL
jgi:hypothetical protein